MKYLLFTALTFLLFACQTEGTAGETSSTEENSSIAATEVNPAAPGFDVAGSDPQAIAIADSVVAAHGGRAAWDRIRFLRFNFFGNRELTWDRYQQRIRISSNGDSTILLYNGSTGEGRAMVDLEEVTDPPILDSLMKRARGIMINDTYWLIQPFKLKDSGVTLTYAGEVAADNQKQRPSHILQLDFKEVGNTPDNRYRIYVDQETYLINAWQYFPTAETAEPALETPFDNYHEIAGVLFSDDRSGRFQLAPVEVLDELDDAVFEEF